MIWSPPIRRAALLPLALAVGAAASASTPHPVNPSAPLARLEPKPAPTSPVVPAARGSEERPAAGIWAEVEAGGRRVRVRSGRRTIGVRPAFPSADLVVAVNEGGGWRDER